MIKKLAMSIFITISILIGAPIGRTYAQGTVDFVPSDTTVNNIGGCDGSAASSPVCQDFKKETNPLFGPDGILTKVATIMSLITGVISLFMMLLGGLRYIMSSGDPAKTSTAKKTIIYAAIGIAIAASAGIIAQFILSQI